MTKATLPLPGPELAGGGGGVASARVGSGGGGLGLGLGRAADATLARDVGRLWTTLLEVSQEHRRLRVVLADLTVVGLREGVLEVRPAASVVLAAKSLVPEIEAVLLRLTGVKIQLVLRVDEAASGAAEQAGPTIETVSEHPLVKQAVELFGGKVIGVQARKQEKGA